MEFNPDEIKYRPLEYELVHNAKLGEDNHMFRLIARFGGRKVCAIYMASSCFDIDELDKQAIESQLKMQLISLIQSGLVRNESFVIV